MAGEFKKGPEQVGGSNPVEFEQEDREVPIDPSQLPPDTTRVHVAQYTNNQGQEIRVESIFLRDGGTIEYFSDGRVYERTPDGYSRFIRKTPDSLRLGNDDPNEYRKNPLKIDLTLIGKVPFLRGLEAQERLSLQPGAQERISYALDFYGLFHLLSPLSNKNSFKPYTNAIINKDQPSDDI